MSEQWTPEEIAAWKALKEPPRAIHKLPPLARYGRGPAHAALDDARAAIGGILSPEEMAAIDLAAGGTGD